MLNRVDALAAIDAATHRLAQRFPKFATLRLHPGHAETGMQKSNKSSQQLRANRRKAKRQAKRNRQRARATGVR
jgi:hypothetical protein